MQKRSWTKIVAVAAALFVAVAGIFYAVSTTGKKSPVLSMNPAFAEYISSYTSGVISSGSTVKIGFARDMVDSSDIGSPTSVKLFSFNPSVRGTVVWLDRRTVEFRPDDRLLSGQLYEASFELSKLIDMPHGLETFEYSFQVIPQNYDVIVTNISPYVTTELTRVKVDGTLSTADYADQEQVEKVVSARQDGKDLKLKWAKTRAT